MTEPTDAELDALRQADNGALNFVTARAFRIIARTVLAKWGTPPAVAGEPFAWADDGSLRSGSTAKAYRVVTNETKRDMPKAAADSFNTPLYTTPQPSQAQAGAVPLTLEAINAMAREYPAEDLCGWSYCMGIVDAEQHHGIKGGQHGTE